MNIKSEFRKHFSKRPAASHKGDFGRVFVLAGSKGMSGACYLTSLAALRSGAGLVTVGVPKGIVEPLIKKMTEAMMKPLPETKDGTLSLKAQAEISKFLSKQDVFAVGPGLSLNLETQELIRKVVLKSEKPVVLDADGLNAFTEHPALFLKLKTKAILTPHPAEFARLFSGNIPKADNDRKEKTVEAAAKYKMTLVLKGHHTVVASPKKELYINETGNPGMATAGSGDVLTGIIAAFLGQEIEPFKAACFGVYIHGLAGDLAKQDKGEISLIASDIIEALPKAFNVILRRSRRI